MTPSRVLLLLAVITFALGALIAFTVVSSGISLLGLGLLGSAFFAAGHLV